VGVELRGTESRNGGAFSEAEGEEQDIDGGDVGQIHLPLSTDPESGLNFTKCERHGQKLGSTLQNVRGYKYLNLHHWCI
jgi:hypothetical protein